MDLYAGQRQRLEIEKQMRREFRALRKLLHPNVVRLVGVVLDSREYVALLMELCDRGSLRKLLDDDPAQALHNPILQLSLALDTACGMAYLHGRKTPMLHRDLKSANVLLTESSGGLAGGRLLAKIGDFGLATGLGTTTIAMTATKADNCGGTPAYKAPEVFENRFTVKSDVYSFGVIAYELACAERPWAIDANGKPHTEASVMMAVVSGERPVLPPTPVTVSVPPSAFAPVLYPNTPELVAISHAALCDIATSAWHAEPKERPSFVALRGELNRALSEVQAAETRLNGGGSPSSPAAAPADAPAAAPSSAPASAVLRECSGSLTMEGGACDIFISFRFGDSHAEAIVLRRALEARG